MQLQGAGFSLRSRYFAEFLSQKQPVDWLEILADQLIGTEGILLEKVTHIAAHYPITLHAVSLNIAGTDPLDTTYLAQLKTLTDLLNPIYVSDHCCWVMQNERYAHDLLPLAYDLSYIPHIASRIIEIQNTLQKPLLLENLSHYVDFEHQCSEAEFLNALCEQTGCGILLDVNNVYVSSQNKNYDAYAWLKQLNPAFIKQCHLAGHVVTEQRLVDTHSQPVPEPVWQLYQTAIELFGAVPTCLEWDNDLPSWDVCLEEVGKIKTALDQSEQAIQTLAYQHKTAETHTLPISLKHFQQQTLDRLLQTATIDDDDGWSVHQHSYRIQRMKALQQVFGALEPCLGSDYWQQLCLKTILQYPSTAADITAEFANFIELLQTEIQRNTGQSKHALIDLARYCWLWYQSFHRAALTEGDMPTLQQTLAEHADETVFALSPQVKLAYFDCPIEQLWRACQPEHQGADAKATLAALPEQRCAMLFYQQDQRVFTIQLDQASFNGLQCLRNPITLNEWAEQAASIEHLDPNAFAHWYANGWIIIKERL